VTVGRIAALKKNPEILVQIQKISDSDMVTAALCDGGTVIQIDIADLLDTDAVQPGKELEGVVHILGTAYQIFTLPGADRRADKSVDGYVDYSTKKIFLMELVQDKDSMEDLARYQREVLRHEIVHAFLYESGLRSSSLSIDSWAKNEEMVDWVAIQFPKIAAAFKEANCEE
jgi:hypothetical protein